MVLKLDVETERINDGSLLERLQLAGLERTRSRKAAGPGERDRRCAAQLEQTYFMDLEPPERMGSEDVMSTC